MELKLHLSIASTFASTEIVFGSPQIKSFPDLAEVEMFKAEQQP